METAQEVKKFKDLNIKMVKPESEGYIGDFLPIEKILGKPFIIQHWKIIPSKFKNSGNGMCLWLQVIYRDELRVITTNSVLLQLTMQKEVTKDMLPLETSITVDEYKAFQFN
jgi:hypothetical protein